MKQVTKCCTLFLFLTGLFSAAQAQVIIDEDFESVCNDYAYSFYEGCHPGWISTSASPDTRSVYNPPNGPGTAYQGSRYAHMYVKYRGFECHQNPAIPTDRGETIAVNYDFQAGVTYSLSYAIAGRVKQRAEWILTDGLANVTKNSPGCQLTEVVPPIPAGSEVWTGASHFNLNIPTTWIFKENIEFTPTANHSQLWFRASNDPGTGLITDYGTAVYIDAVTVERLSPPCPSPAFTPGFAADCCVVLEFENNPSYCIGGWDFGDGNGNNDPGSIVYCYEQPGTYTITHTVDGQTHSEVHSVDCKFDCELSNAEADFFSATQGSVAFFLDISIPDDYCPFVSAYWDFGDGNSCDEPNCNHASHGIVYHSYDYCGTYEVCLTLTDECGCVTSICQDVVIEEACVVDPCNSSELTVDFDLAIQGTYGLFLDLSNSNKECPIVSTTWDFGDAFSCSEPNCDHFSNGVVYHRYDYCGTYEVCLTVEDACACTKTLCKEVLIDNACVLDPCLESTLIADFDYALQGQYVFLLDQSTTQEQCEITAYEWDFGDGNSCNEPNCNHASHGIVYHGYDYCGTYEVCLTIWDECACTSTNCQEVTVSFGDCGGGGGTGGETGGERSGEIDELEVLPDLLQFHSCSPNPFSDQVQIDFSLASDTEVEVTLYDWTGKEVNSLRQSKMENAGRHNWQLNTENLAAGMYILVLKTEGEVRTQKLMKAAR